MKLTLTLSLDGAAFRDPEDNVDGYEAVRLLRQLADRIEDGMYSLRPGHLAPLVDVNGNTAGHWRVTR